MDAPAIELTLTQAAVQMLPFAFSITFASKPQPFFARYAQVVLLSFVSGTVLALLIPTMFDGYFATEYLTKVSNESVVTLIGGSLLGPLLLLPFFRRMQAKSAFGRDSKSP